MGTRILDRGKSMDKDMKTGSDGDVATKEVLSPSICKNCPL